MPVHRSCFDLVEKTNRIMTKIISIRSKPVMVGLSSELTLAAEKPDVGSVKESSACVIVLPRYGRSRKMISRISA